MNFTAQQKDLATVLARCQGVANEKSTMPILSSVLLTTAADSVTIAATNLRMTVTDSLPADATKPGSIAVNARALYERIKAMPDGLVTLAVTGDALKLTANGSARKYTMHSIPGAEFPTVNAPDAAAKWMPFSGAMIAQLIASVQFSVSIDDTRPALAGALLECTGEVARMVSTDGHRMSLAELPYSVPMASTIIPRNGIAELRKLAAEMGGNVDVTFIGPDAWFRAGPVTLGVRMTDGPFPPYKQVIPKPRAAVAKVDRDAFVSALRAVSLAAEVTDGVSSGVVIALAGNVMRLSSESSDRGNAGDEVPVEYSGSDARVGVNSRYLLDWLGAMPDETVTFSLGGELDPIVMTGAGTTGVVMPSRL
jgi:DNA polymerase III subunit beta